MPEAVSSFGTRLQQFARTIDIVDKQTWNELERLVKSYVLNEFGMEYFEFMAEDEVNNQRGLRTQWTSDRGERSKSVKDSDGNWVDQTAMAFDLNKPMWIVHRDQGELHQDVDPAEYEDLWSELPDIPAYTSTIPNIHTSIIVPVRGTARVLGVLDFEDRTYRRFNPIAEQELTKLADAVAIAYELRLASRTQSDGTKKALSELGDALTRRRFPTSLSRPQVFFASSNRADPEVMQIIQEVLDSHEPWIRVCDWRRTADTGNITTHTLRDIATSRFGICYLSEQSPEGSPLPFADNPNVIFEAGMLHAFTNTAAEAPTQWIPIREHKDYTGEAPSDFLQQRTIVVPRAESATRDPGEVKVDEFKATLSEWLDRLIHSR